MNLLEMRINHAAITHNMGVLQDALAPGVKLLGVVKADGYNHGAVDVARTLVAAGVDYLGVATLPEALELRAAGISGPLLCWLWSEQDTETLQAALSAGIEVGVPSMGHAHAVVDAATHLSLVARCHIKVETGMHRSGVDPADWVELFDLLAASPAVRVQGMMSHFACADEPEHPMNTQQEQEFAEAVALAEQRGLTIPIKHLCNSPGALSRPQAHWDMVRAGVALYGLEPIAGREHGLIPAMNWVARVLVVKPLRRGEGTSYSLTWSAPTDGWIAIIPAGYADGVPRAAQGHLEVTIAGQRYPQVGRVCMDQMVVWLGDNPARVAPGAEATIIGRAPAMTATELAEAMGTLNYEIVCRPTGRSVRVHEEEH